MLFNIYLSLNILLGILVLLFYNSKKLAPYFLKFKYLIFTLIASSIVIYIIISYPNLYYSSLSSNNLFILLASNLLLILSAVFTYTFCYKLSSLDGEKYSKRNKISVNKRNFNSIRDDFNPVFDENNYNSSLDNNSNISYNNSISNYETSQEDNEFKNLEQYINELYTKES